MRILFLANKVPYPPNDGGAIATLGLIEAFADAGHQVTLLAMNTRKHHVTPYEIPETLSSKITIHMVEVPALITAFGALKNLLFSTLPYNASRFIDKKYENKLAVLLQNLQFDIVQFEGLYIYPYIRTIKKYSQAKIVYRSHNVEYEIWERSVKQARGLKKMYLKIIVSRLKKFEQGAVNLYDMVLPITSRDNMQLTLMGNTKPSQVVPAGFKIEKVEKATNLFTKNLFFIGAVDWAPNQEGLMWFLSNCWPAILEKHPDIRLKVAGRNSPKWFTRKLNVENVDYIGEVESAKDYMLSNGIMIAPLLSGSGMRVKIIEGMMYAKCIVTTPVGCEGIDVIDGEHLFIAETPQGFINHISCLLNNEERILKTGINAYKFVKNEFDNNAIINRVIHFFEKHLK